MSAMDEFNRAARALRDAQYNLVKNLPFGGPRLVAEGDSWFQHPIEGDIIDALSSLPLFYKIRCLCSAGDELARMLQQAEFVAAIRDEQPAAFVFSGGGNDVVGQTISTVIKESSGATKASQCIDKAALDAEMARIEGMYRQVYRLVQGAKAGLPMIVHGYAHPKPGKKYFGIIDWGLGDALTAKNVPDKLQDDVAALLIDAFNKMLKGLPRTLPEIRHVDLRQVVSKNDFRDEMHLKSLAAVRAAKAFHAVLEKAIP